MQTLETAVFLELQCDLVCGKRQMGGNDGIPAVEWLVKTDFLT